MKNIEQRSQYDKETGEIYQAIGRFTVKFEHVVQAMKQGIVFILELQGLRNQQLSTILLSDHTAEPIRSIYNAIVSEVRVFTKDERLILNSILEEIKVLTVERNDIIHGTWFVGRSNADSNSNFSDLPAHNYKKQNSKIKQFRNQSCDFDHLSIRCDDVVTLVNRFTGCIMDNLSIVNNFDAINKK